MTVVLKENRELADVGGESSRGVGRIQTRAKPRIGRKTEISRRDTGRTHDRARPVAPTKKTKIEAKMRYISTRGGMAPKRFLDILVGGLASDGRPYLSSAWWISVFPGIAILLTVLAVMDNGLDRQSIIGGASIYPFVHNVLLAARDVGLGGVLTTVLARQEPAAREVLHLAPNHAVAALLALGHPAKELTRLKRADVTEFTTVDHLDGPAFS